MRRWRRNSPPARLPSWISMLGGGATWRRGPASWRNLSGRRTFDGHKFPRASKARKIRLKIAGMPQGMLCGCAPRLRHGSDCARGKTPAVPQMLPHRNRKLGYGDEGVEGAVGAVGWIPPARAVSVEFAAGNRLRLRHGAARSRLDPSI